MAIFYHICSFESTYSTWECVTANVERLRHRIMTTAKADDDDNDDNDVDEVHLVKLCKGSDTLCLLFSDLF